MERIARRQFARRHGALGEQPRDDVHQPRRHLERFARKRDPRERIERLAIAAAAFVEIGARLVGEQHRLDIKRVDQFAMDSRIVRAPVRSEEHTSELQSLMRTSYAGFCLKKKISIIPLYS